MDCVCVCFVCAMRELRCSQQQARQALDGLRVCALCVQVRELRCSQQQARQAFDGLRVCVFVCASERIQVQSAASQTGA